MARIMCIPATWTGGLYYAKVQRDWREIIFLWEGSRLDEQLNGWALLPPSGGHSMCSSTPGARQSTEQREMYIWAEEQIVRIVRQDGGKDIRTMWVFEDDQFLVNHLSQHRFVRGEDYLTYYERSLETPIPSLGLPPGFQVRSVVGEDDGQKRAIASHAAFGSDKPFEVYWPRYQRFMHSPA